MTYDPTRRLVMATFKTVHGHGLPAGTFLTLASEPAKAGEVDEDTARLLWNKKAAVYEEDHRPTPVETPQQEAARIVTAVVADPDAPVETPADLVTWQQDDDEVLKKAGDRVTVVDLRLIAGREGVTVETDDNKGDLIAKIVAARAAKALG